MTHNVVAPQASGDDHGLMAMQRRAAFEAEFGSGRNVANAIRTCLIETYTHFGMFDGEDGAEAMFASLLMLRFPIGAWPGKWREFLTADAAELCMQMMVGKAFRELAAYGRYGISLNGGVTELDRGLLLNEAHVHAGGLQSLAPWSFRGTELEKIRLQSSARRNLDDFRAVEPRSLAALGDVDENVIGTLIAQGDLPCVCGRVPAAVALRWLRAEAQGFRDSIWRTQEPFRDLRGRQPLAA